MQVTSYDRCIVYNPNKLLVALQLQLTMHYSLLMRASYGVSELLTNKLLPDCHISLLADCSYSPALCAAALRGYVVACDTYTVLYEAESMAQLLERFHKHSHHCRPCTAPDTTAASMNC